MALPIRYIFAIASLGLLSAGIYDYLKNFEENGCEMTWMFEYPKYIKIHMDDRVARRFPQYGLHIYGEGEYARKVSSLKLTGIPVLFIPGNAGSYRQVRSLASVALRKAESSRTKFEFNYFSVNLNEELVGLFGGLIQDQTEFVHECIKLILSFYAGAPKPPTSVILVGHSMGGLVARALFTLPTFDPRLVTTIITQATPHQAPAIAIDSLLSSFYDEINTYWRSMPTVRLRDVTVVSTGGGYRDILVRNGLTTLKGVVSQHRGVSTSTMSVPKAWVSTDHLCAVWCRQMVLVTKRAMFDIIDPNTHQVTTDADRRMRVFRHHFLTNSGSQKHRENIPGELTLDPKIPWEVKQNKLFRFSAEKMSSTKYFAVPVIRETEESAVEIDSVIIMSNITRQDWVCACTLKEKQDRCTSCINLSAKAQSLPPNYSNKKVIRMYLKELGEATHIVVIAAHSKQKHALQLRRRLSFALMPHGMTRLYATGVYGAEQRENGASITDSMGKPASLYRLMGKLLGKGREQDTQSPAEEQKELANSLNSFFIAKIEKIRHGLACDGDYSEPMFAVCLPQYYSTETALLHVTDKLQRATDEDIKSWMTTNKLKLNDTKTEALLVGTRQQLSKVDAVTLKVADADIRPIRCSEYEGIVYTLNVPWSNESTYGFSKFRETGQFPVKVQSGKPRDAEDEAVHLEMFLHPSCSYHLKLTTSPVHVMGQFVRFYGVLYPCFFVCVLLLALRGHFLKLASGDICCPGAEAVFLYSKPFAVLPFVVTFRYVASYKNVEKLLTNLGLPKDDKEALESRDLWFQALSFLLFISAFLISLIHVRFTQSIIAVVSRVLGLVFRWVPEFVLNLSVYVEGCVCVLALVSAMTVCGSVSILLCYFLMVTKVLWLCNRWASTRVREDESKFNFFFILLMIYLWLLVLNSPSLVVWAKNFRYNMALSTDPSRIVGVITSVVSLLYFINDKVEFNKSSCTMVSWLLYMMVFASLLYAMDSIYRLSYVIAAVLCIIAIPKLQAVASAAMFPPKTKDE
ncbi:LOW QUALITY PROTEIN: GPI inositol-deacylase-like [Haliotis rubra]|uniref:LOW QUALITY PROTEIN: GPI inositol-deacylase-like n=1 Tax=Haliotis rubra TaxID=36100 RepID=UPI001EE50ADD|nr:LOW QUALITY PROTEIN: GPI inositol-deacylase-like [Haliotis rubra]